MGRWVAAKESEDALGLEFPHSLDGEQLYTFRWQGERLKDNSEKELI